MCGTHTSVVETSSTKESQKIKAQATPTYRIVLVNFVSEKITWGRRTGPVVKIKEVVTVESLESPRD